MPFTEDRPSAAEQSTASEATATVTESGAAGVPAAAPLPRGATLDRYVVLDVAGAGSMGVVYTAFDPDLDRKVALKVVHPARLAAGQSGTIQRRLQHEAQALARLDHPNVITVFDVGVVGGQLYITTELVDGVDLATWLRAERRSVAAIVSTFLQAGRGLEAAHHAGFVHRDFKPGNTMVGADGRVRVVDFGLARDGAALAQPLEPTGAPGTPAGLDLDETAPSGAVGTPAYSAPEQLAGAPVTAAADQFSFCVALYRALHDRLPFPPEATEQPSAPDAWVATPPSSSLPAFLRRVLRRGLRFHPQDRYPSMQEALAELERGQGRLRRRLIGAGLAVALMAAAGAWHVSQDRQQGICTGGASRFADAWNDDRQRAIDKNIAASDQTYAAARWDGTRSLIDAYGTRWSTMHDEACRATAIEARQSDELLDLRMACLDQRLREVDALANVLAENPRWIEQSDAVVRGLTPVAVCADVEALSRPLKPPAEATQAAAVDLLREELAAARARLGAGDFDAGLAQAQRLVGSAEATGYLPLIAEALLLQARFEEALVQPEPASATLQRALEAASAGGHSRAVAEAFVRWARIAGYQQNDAAQGDAYAALAAAAVDQLSEQDALAAALADHRGLLRFQQGDYAGALENHQTALAIRQRTNGADEPAVARTLTRIGNAHLENGELTSADEHFARALDIRRRHLGAQHPEIARLLSQLGSVALERGELDLALERFERARTITEQSLAADHPDRATPLTYLGHALVAAGRHAEAITHYRLAQSLLEQAFGPDDPRLAVVASGLGGAAVVIADYPAARDGYETALRLRSSAFGDDHPAVAEIAFNLGEVAKRQGRHRDALARFRQALAVWDRPQSDNGFLIGVALTGVGESLLSTGSPRQASTALERALTLLPADRNPKFLAKAQFALARVLADLGGDPIRAAALASAARDGFEAAGPTAQSERITVEAWLADHRGAAR